MSEKLINYNLIDLGTLHNMYSSYILYYLFVSLFNSLL